MKERIRTNAIETRGLLISKRWVQAVAIVVLFGFFVLGLLAYRTYTDQAPIPAKVVRPDGQLLFTGADVVRSQNSSAVPIPSTLTTCSMMLPSRYVSTMGYDSFAVLIVPASPTCPPPSG